MKVSVYSDLHLECEHVWSLPGDLDADVIVLAGDILVLDNYGPIECFFRKCDKPILFVAGNHEYYTRYDMSRSLEDFRQWAKESLPQMKILDNEGVSFGNVHFFGGTMWTDFMGGDVPGMKAAVRYMQDFRRIVTQEGASLTPGDTIGYHGEFTRKLLDWLRTGLDGHRIVITHHEPALCPVLTGRRGDNSLQAAFTSSDMAGLILEHQPDFWLYGHTHAHVNYSMNKTRLISNPLGYPVSGGGYEAAGFDPYGYSHLLDFR